MNTQEDAILLVSENTGEVVSKIEEGSKIIIKTAAQIEYANRYKKWKVGSSFMKFYDEYYELPQILTPAEFSIFVKITKYIEFKTNRLMDNDKILTIKDLSEILEYDYTTLKKYFVRYKVLNIIRIEKSSYDSKKAIYINPSYCTKGNEILTFAINLFR